MSSTTQFLWRLVIFLLILNCLYPVLVLGQDETTPTPNPPQPPATSDDPEVPTTRPKPSPGPTPSSSPELTPTVAGTTVPGPNPAMQPSAPSLPSSLPTIIPTKSLTTSDSEHSTTAAQEADPPEATTAGCALRCLAAAAGSVGCGNTGNRACLCTRFRAYLREAESCMQGRSCPFEESGVAISQQQGVCPSGPDTSNTNANTSTPYSPNSTPRPPPSPTRTTTPPSLGPTVGTGDRSSLGVSGTVQTTYTASTGLTTTRIATMLEAVGPGGNGGAGPSGSGATGMHVGCGMSTVAAIVGVIAGAIFVL